MDRFNLKQLCLVSSISLLLVACASKAPQPTDEVSSVDATSLKSDTTSTVAANPAAKSAAVEVSDTAVAAAKVELAPDASNDKTMAVAEIEEPKPITQTAEKAAPVAVTPAESSKPVAVSKPKTVIPTDPKTFLVQADQKDATHPFYNVGDKRGFLVNGVQGKTLVLTRGEVYSFEVDTGIQHDFYFSTSPRGWGAGTVTDGVEGQFTYDGTVTVKPNPSTPAVIYYQCRNHKNMGGMVHVINKGEKVDMTAGVDTSALVKKPVVKVTEQQVKQKLSYAKMLMSSESAKRILDSDNVEAKDLKKKATEHLVKADSLLSAGNTNDAMASVDEALRHINTASRLEPSSSADDTDYKAQYNETLKEIEGYKVSYKKNAAKSEPKGKAKLDEQKFNVLMTEAQSLATANDHKSAMKPLQAASTMITDVISVMLDDTVVVYDKTFSTLKEEYEYEVSRYKAYLELVPLAKEQRNPNPNQLKLMEQFVGKAEGIATEGSGVAAKGDYKLAIQAYQAATDNVKRALMLVGVR